MADISRGGIIVIALVASLLLFSAGWYSGLYARDAISKETTTNVQHNVQLVKGEIGGQLRTMESHLDSAQTERILVDTLRDDEACDYLGIITDDLMSELGSFWARLPPRLEALTREESASFEPVREDYNRLSVRGWVFFRDVHRRCRTSVPILYLYKTDCPVCVRQGEQLDYLKTRLNGTQPIIFTVDTDANYNVLTHIKDHYDVHSVPAIIAGDSVIQGRVVSSDELARITLKGGTP